MVRGRGGFTIIELIVAVTVLTLGLLALVGANALVTQLLSSGDRASTAMFFAQERMETLRGTDCDDLTAGSETRGAVYDLSWETATAFGGNAQRVQLVVQYPSGPGRRRADTVETSLLCVR
jgi:prepilin-type N-terminal cleavage/methylation domain-containing protein